jgi:hypothetical protein
MELVREENPRDLELQHACAACGGPLVVRVTPGTARAVCRACRSFTTMRLVATEDGLSLVQRAAAAA